MKKLKTCITKCLECPYHQKRFTRDSTKKIAIIICNFLDKVVVKCDPDDMVNIGISDDCPLEDF